MNKIFCVQARRSKYFSRQISSQQPDTNILVLNCGSSSIKFQVGSCIALLLYLMHLSCLPQVLNPVTESCQLKGQADRLNGQDGKLKFTWRGEEVRESLEGTSYQVSKERIYSDTFPLLVHLQKTADIILDIASQVKLDFVGHRVVHGGERFKEATEITEETLRNLTDIQGIHS